MAEFISQLLALPPELQVHLLSQVTDVDQIIKLSLVNTQIRNLLKKSITTLTTDKNPLYLVDDWLTDYRFLRSISDNIIFMTLNPNLVLPIHLKKFTIYIPGIHPFDIMQNLTNQLKRPLHDYTVRIIYQRYAFYIENIEYMASSALIIDDGFYTILHNYSDKETPHTDDEINLDEDIENILINAGINLQEFDTFKKPNTLYKYTLDNNQNEDFILNVAYPNIKFREFLNDLSKELNVDLLAKLPIYQQTGYIYYTETDNLIRLLIERYIALKNLKISDSARGMYVMDDKFISKYKEEIRAKYVADPLGEEKNQFFISYLSIESPGFISEDRNLLISHLYLTKPTYYELILNEYMNFEL